MILYVLCIIICILNKASQYIMRLLYELYIYDLSMHVTLLNNGRPTPAISNHVSEISYNSRIELALNREKIGT